MNFVFLISSICDFFIVAKKIKHKNYLYLQKFNYPVTNYTSLSNTNFNYFCNNFLKFYYHLSNPSHSLFKVVFNINKYFYYYVNSFTLTTLLEQIHYSVLNNLKYGSRGLKSAKAWKYSVFKNRYVLERVKT